MRAIFSISSSARRVVIAISGLVFLSLLIWALPNVSHAAFQQSLPLSSPLKSKPRMASFVPGEILVRFRTETTPATQTSKLGQQAAMYVEENGSQISIKVERVNSGPEIVTGLRVARVAPDETERAIEALRKRPDVVYAEPNYIRRKSTTPNDPRFFEMWNHKNTGQFGQPIGTDINSEQAWNTTTGSRDIVVAVVDEGIDVNHQDLQGNIWRNPGEVAGNGVDDDSNGLTDDIN